MWSNLYEVFTSIHPSQKYVIMRNYEEFSENNFYMQEHPDVDILTDQPRKLVEALNAKPRFIKDDGIHYIIIVADIEVIIDIRTVGDGYYDRRWQTNMLKTRRQHPDGYYIMSDDNYYYSLVYHAFLQKKEISKDYLYRLNSMAHKLNISASSVSEHLKALCDFMQINHFYYTFPLDIWVPLNLKLIDKKFVRKQINVIFRDLKYFVLSHASKLKHKLINNIGE